MSGRRKLTTIVSDELMQEIDRRAAEQQDRTRAVLNEAGRPDLVQELDARLREVANGVSGARNVWHTLSEAQRDALYHIERYGGISRGRGTRYIAIDQRGIFVVCRLPTARKLCANGLISPDGGAFDPEAKFVVTERGRFALMHGRAPQIQNEGR